MNLYKVTYCEDPGMYDIARDPEPFQETLAAKRELFGTPRTQPAAGMKAAIIASSKNEEGELPVMAFWTQEVWNRCAKPLTAKELALYVGAKAMSPEFEELLKNPV